MKTTIELYNTNHRIDLYAENDEKEIISKVQEEFKQYACNIPLKDTNAIKLRYLDAIREKLHPTFKEYIKKYALNIIDDMGHPFTCHQDKIEIEFNYNFVNNAYKDGSRNFYKNEETSIFYNNLATIIKAVMNCEF